MTQKIFIAFIACLLPLAATNAQAWTIQHDYDSQTADDACADFGASNSKVSSIQANSGTQSCEHTIGLGQTGDEVGVNWGGIIGFPMKLVKGDEIWIRIRTFMPAGFNSDSNGEGEHLKFLRVHTRDAANDNFGYNDWYITPSKYSDGRTPTFSHEFIYEGDPLGLWSYVTDMSKAPDNTTNVWETYEYYLKLDSIPASKGGQARIRAWKNNILMLDVDDRPTLKHAGAYADRMHLFTYWNGGSPAAQVMYTDDLFMTTAPPSNVDASGNRYIGDAAVGSPPNPPIKNP